MSSHCSQPFSEELDKEQRAKGMEMLRVMEKETLRVMEKEELRVMEKEAQTVLP